VSEQLSAPVKRETMQSSAASKPYKDRAGCFSYAWLRTMHRGRVRKMKDRTIYRVHECVFGVLALQSEPVDPGPEPY
jgi:PNKP adenylyltransferase domain, C-terminal region